MKLLTITRDINTEKGVQEEYFNINMDHIVSWEFCISETNRLNFSYTTINNNSKTVNISKFQSYDFAASHSKLLTRQVIEFLNNNHKSVVI